MTTIRRFLLWPTALFVSLFVFGMTLSYAAGDGGVSPVPAPIDPTKNPAGALSTIDQFWAAIAGKKWGIACVFGTIIMVAFARAIAPRIHGKFGAWINTSRASAAMALISGFFTAIGAQYLKGGHFSPNILVYGFGAGVGAIGGYNAFWDLVFPNDKKPAAGVEVAPLPPPMQAAMLLPFLLLGALTLNGCTTGGAALGKCELNNLPQSVQTLVAVVTTALSGATWQQDLTALEPSANGQLDCIVSAIIASMQKRAEVTPSSLAVIEHGRAWLALKKK